MSGNHNGWKARVFVGRVSRWVAAELDKGGDGGDDWCESMSLRSKDEIGTTVPTGTIKAHVFAIGKRREKAANGGRSDG